MSSLPKAARADIGRNDIVRTMFPGKGFDQFATDLPVGANHQNSFHFHAP